MKNVCFVVLSRSTPRVFCNPEEAVRHAYTVARTTPYWNCGASPVGNDDRKYTTPLVTARLVDGHDCFMADRPDDEPEVQVIVAVRGDW